MVKRNRILYVYGCSLSYVMVQENEQMTTIACTRSTRDTLRSLKRGDIVTYEDLFREMIRDYDTENKVRADE